jgi:hypothetical protein
MVAIDGNPLTASLRGNTFRMRWGMPHYAKKGAVVKIMRLFAACVGSLALVALGSGAASAGEVNGNGQPTSGPDHAHSICVFSGLNDTPDDPIEGGRVQSYGQIVKAGGKSFVPSPGEACNGHTGFLAGGGGE